mgnify:CR=1 FL=1
MVNGTDLRDELKMIEEHFNNLTAEQYKLNKKKIDFGKVKFAFDSSYVRAFEGQKLQTKFDVENDVKQDDLGVFGLSENRIGAA